MITFTPHFGKAKANCSCGNSDQRKFIKAINAKLVVDERGRQHHSKELVLRCTACDNEIVWDEAVKSVKSLIAGKEKSNPLGS